MALKGGSIPQRRITVLEKASITSKSSLILAEVDGQRVLLVAGAEQVTPVEYVNFNSCESSGLDSQFETAEVQCVEEIKLSA